MIFDIPDDVIISRTLGLRYDPVTNKTYHLKYDPPPKNSQIESRLIKKASDTEPATRGRLSVYRKSVDGVVNAFKNVVNVMQYPEGIMGNEELVYKDVFNIIGRKPISRVPRCFKVLLTGLPGSGKTRVAEMLQRKFGFVHGIFFVYKKKDNLILSSFSSYSYFGGNRRRVHSRKST